MIRKVQPRHTALEMRSQLGFGVDGLGPRLESVTLTRIRELHRGIKGV